MSKRSLFILAYTLMCFGVVLLAIALWVFSSMNTVGKLTSTGIVLLFVGFMVGIGAADLKGDE